jgi:CheY-like chemotaxis protein/DNA-binding XRE family transcriptional regulator
VVKVDVQKSFGNSVRAWRGRLGLSQEQLAERAGLHRTYVCDIERGARNVSLKSVEKLARALEISLPTLFCPPGTVASEKPLVPENAPYLTQISEGIVDILFVEDDEDDAELALKALKRGKIFNRIEWVRDGAEALDFVFCTGAYSKRRLLDGPQIVLLDLNLPKVSGLEVLRRIKSDIRTRSIHVVVLTASKFDRDLATSLRLGAEAYIVKPLDFQSFSEVTPGLSLQWALLKTAPTVIA